jgi:hypothetical protein
LTKLNPLLAGFCAGNPPLLLGLRRRERGNVPPNEPIYKTFTDVDGTIYDVQLVVIEPGVTLEKFIGNDGTEFEAEIHSGKESLLDISERIIQHYYME